MFGYRIPEPDQAMLISGRKVKDANKPFRVVTGSGAFVLPPFRRARMLTLAMMEAEVNETCYSKHGIEVDLRAVMAFKVGATDEQIVNAGRRFVTNQRNMVDRAGKIFAGHLRSVAGSMSVEQMIQERQTLASEVLDASEGEMEKLGLVVDSFQIESIDDKGQNYVARLAAPHKAEVERNAAVAKAENDRASAEAQQIAARKQASYQRETELNAAQIAADVAKARADADSAARIAQVEAQQKSQVAEAQANQEAEVARAKADAAVGEAEADRDRRRQVAIAKQQAEVGAESARAGQAGPLAQATAAHEVAVAQTALAEQTVLQREQELKRDVVVPANADKEKRIAQAEAEAQAVERNARALASSNRVQLDMERVKQLPAVAAALAGGLKDAHLTILDGAEGLDRTVASLATQAKTLFEVMRTVSAPTSTNGAGPEAAPELTPEVH